MTGHVVLLASASTGYNMTNPKCPIFSEGRDLKKIKAEKSDFKCKWGSLLHIKNGKFSDYVASGDDLII